MKLLEHSKNLKSTDNQSSAGRDPGNNSGGPSGGGGGETSFLINQGTAALAQSNLNNNLYIDVDFEGGEETMGDLQSPQYVKRTAHMFDSRFQPEPGATERNARNPSYLNVSKSVSGYSCMTYNNGSETVSNRTVLGNGTSLMTTGTRASATTAGTRLKTDFAIHSPFSRKTPHTDEDSDHSSSQSATSPPPSLPPINTTSAGGRFSESSFFQNGMNRGDELLDDTPYIPSHGKSFIMQRIERLYGTDALTNKGVLTRKSSHVTTISITRESPSLGTERIIPIKVEPRDDHENNLYNNEVTIHEVTNDEQCLLIGRKSSGSGGIILPEIVSASKEENGRHIQHRRSRGSFDDTDEDEDGTRASRCLVSPTKIQSPTVGLDNSGHLNGNANPYGNGVAASPQSRSAEGDRPPLSASPSRLERSMDESVTLDKIIHTNGNHHENEVDGQDCTPLKKALSRESSAESDDTNGCSENSLELGVSDAESKKSSSRKSSQDNSLYSSRGATSPVKPKPKPKPKDMALLRTLSRSPALKTENLDKTAISLSIVQPDASVKVEEDQPDFALPHIKTNIISPTNISSETSADKENTLAPVADNVTQAVKTKDGNYYLNEMDIVRTKILQLSGNAEKELDSLDPSEDRAGCVLAAIGKGNLLVKKKFKQFEGLCHANLKGKSGDEPETTDEDLGGFWDMVMIQVEQIYTLFEDLEKNDQDKKSSSAPSTPSKISSPKRTVVNAKSRASVGATPKINPAAAKARDEARRKLLAEKRKAMKNQMQETQQEAASEGNETEVQIFAPETSHTG
ncbi:Disks large-associated protein 4 [Orchesella cincta]|uniref:Disks large-associated protein 4 n=1 Tax=Orchesella cincta TaxID=48709 RepID=A0A1D2N2T0_ORCCI|nr:Disks large-associated protein 4 [Orchesella cincta]